MLNPEYIKNKESILKLYKEGYSLNSIIEKLNLSISNQVLNSNIKKDNEYIKNRLIRLKLEDFKDNIIKKYNRGISLNALANEFNSDRDSIISILNKYTPSWELRSNSYYCKCKTKTNLTKHQKDIINGVIISDGCIFKGRQNSTAKLSLKNIKEEWIDYLILNLPFKYSKGKIESHICYFTNELNNKNYESVSKEKFTYNTKTDLSLNYIYEKWTKNGKKILPTDLEITPIMLLNWFYGDGSSTINKNTITITLCTDNFTLQEVVTLQNKLDKIDIHFNIYLKNKKHPRLVICKRSEVTKFYNYIKPVHCVSAFDYKFKEYLN